jgi:hypothetical protein
MLRAMRVVAAVLLLVQVASACTQGSGSDTPIGIEASARLDALGERWMTTPATITYRTTQRKPGEASSPHQCLRQLVGDAVGGHGGVQSGLRICSRIGELRLAWDPPDRWRMDQVASRNRLTLLSTADGSVRCHAADLPAPRCVTAESDGPFGSLIVPPALTVDQIRSVVRASARRTIAGFRTDCFAVEGGPAGAIHTVEWCYSPEGLLLFLNDTVEGGRVVTAEANEVSRQVSKGDFVVAPT